VFVSRDERLAARFDRVESLPALNHALQRGNPDRAESGARA
jgi:hypothetical protein